MVQANLLLTNTYLLKTTFFYKYLYRVSHIEMALMNWLWWIKICKLDLVWRWFWNAEIGNFWVAQPFKKNSLRQKGYQLSVENWIFDDPFYKKGPVLVVLLPGKFFLVILGFWGQFITAVSIWDTLQIVKTIETVAKLNASKKFPLQILHISVYRSHHRSTIFWQSGQNLVDIFQISVTLCSACILLYFFLENVGLP